MGAVMATPVIVTTDANLCFCANASHLIQPYDPLPSTICSIAPHLATKVT